MLFKGISTRSATLIFALASLVGTTMVFIAYWHTKNIEKEALERAAASYSHAITAFRSFYSTEVLSKLHNSDIEASHLYKGKPKTIPIPATMTIDLAQKINSRDQHLNISVVSKYPYSWRKRHDLNLFEHQAFDWFNNSAESSFSKIIEIDGEDFLGFASPMRMSEACVACHNSHSDSPKTNWKLGDVRGLQVIYMPLTVVGASNQLGLSYLIGFIILSFVGAFSVILWLTNNNQLAFAEVDLKTRKLEKALTQLEDAKELAEQANQAKGGFLANMSHEIRTPMNAIIGLSHLAMNSEYDKNQQLNYFRKINTSATNLLNIINDILDFSKIEAGRLEIESADFDLDKLLQSVYDINYIRAEDKGIYFRIHRDFLIPNILKGDLVRLNQILTNLISNAIKFTEQGGVKVDISPVAIADDSVRLRFNISDTGMGMNEDQIETLFEAFTQADASTTRQFGGTGLGLSITKQLTDLMDGEIRIESQPNEGTCISVELPFSVSEIIVQTNHNLDDQQLLVLGNDPELEALLHSLNLHYNSHPFGAGSLPDIEGYLIEHPVDCLIIVDQSNAECDLIDYIAQLRHQVPEVILIPSVLITTPRNAQAIQDVRGYDLHTITNLYTPSLLIETLESSLLPLTESTLINLNLASRNQLEGVLGAKVLVAEDNPINTEVVKGMLERMGIIAVCVENGQEALDKLSSEPFDLVLLDMQMPVMDGYETAEIIRSNDDFKNLPVIALTAHAMVGDQQRSLELGLNGHITKPINQDELHSALIQWIKPGMRSPVPVEWQNTYKNLTETTDLPTKLPGLNLRSALSRISNDISIYSSLWNMFDRKYDDAVEHLTSLVSEKSLSKLHVYSHGLKGVAANLGAEGLAKIATDIEKLESLETDRASTLIKLVEQEISVIKDSLQQLFEHHQKPENTSEVGDNNRQSETINHQQLIVDLEHLRHLISAGDTAALSASEKILDTVANSNYEAEIRGIASAISDFEFEKAEQLLAIVLAR